MKDTVLKYTDILILTTETKLDDTFLIFQFLVDGFRNKHGEGNRVYIRDTIPSKILENSRPNDIECLFIIFFSKNGSGSFVERIIRHIKMMSILIILIKPLTPWHLQQLRKDFPCWRFQHRNNWTLHRIIILQTWIK